jgi:anti-sigma regulatory factor (Ser/Thr protein kinase)
MNVMLRLAHHPSSIAEARHAVDELGVALDTRTLATVRLLISELVTNSVRHAGAGASGHIDLTVAVRRDCVRVEVEDTGTGFVPRARVEGQDESSGWGLHLLEALSHRWGTDRANRTRVWFEIDGAAAAAPA